MASSYAHTLARTLAGLSALQTAKFDLSLCKQEALWTGLLPQIRMISGWCEGHCQNGYWRRAGSPTGRDQGRSEVVTCEPDVWRFSYSWVFPVALLNVKSVFCSFKYLLHGGQIYIFQVRSDSG